MREIAADVERWRARGERIAIATVVAMRRSAPRPVGAKLAISESGELAGSVSGGCVEAEVSAQASEVLAGGPPRLLTYGIADDVAFDIGLPCGGEIDVFVSEPQDEVIERLLAVTRNDERAAHLVVVAGEPLGAELVVAGEGGRIGSGSATLAGLADEAFDGRTRLVAREDATVFVDVHAPPPRLLVFGAVDTAEALCRAARGLGWRTTVADARPKLATSERMPSADELIVAWPDEALARAAPDRETAVVVLTHEDRFDVPALAGALATDAYYVGALGSRKNQERRRARLLDEGVEEEALERIAGPCGLDLGAATPAEIAVSILAEILAVRGGRSGGRLKEGRGRIHANVA
jgi:xanthine dehydrogenase accessory factor